MLPPPTERMDKRMRILDGKHFSRATGSATFETEPATLEKCFPSKIRILSTILSVGGGNKYMYKLPCSGR